SLPVLFLSKKISFNPELNNPELKHRRFHQRQLVINIRKYS
ncbi:uncharacterized protein METZ01_LOCUS260076, partial [marine metagenome]